MRSFTRTVGRAILIAACSMASAASAQCPQLFDSEGLPSDSPIWISCSGTDFTLIIGSPTAVGAFTIDWGDGSPQYSGAGMAPPQTVTHVYTLAVAEYTVTFNELASGCTVTGTVIMEQSTSASIQIPVGGLTQVCAPQAVDFINSSTNTSPNTVFMWNFGDGETWTTYDYTNLGQTLSHTYLPGTVGCETTVRLSAENACNTLQGGPSIATFNPIRIWDIDTANISPSATLLCWPDNEVTFLNTTDRNCINQGNIFQRYEYWNFGNYWGVGQDSLINWTPWPPTFPHTIAYPAIGSYQVMMLDSNYCGIDTAYVTINIVPPPSVTVLASPTPVCAGDPVHFDENTNGGANYSQWDFDDGNGFNATSAGDQDHSFSTPGTFDIQYAASIQGATAGCADTATAQVTVLPSPTAQFALDQDAACTSLTTDPTNSSTNAVNYLWDFGDGSTDTQFDPPPHTYATAGDYTITLTASNNQGCSDSHSQVVHVYPPPQPVIGAQNVCEGAPAEFTDLTVTDPGNPIEHWYWDFGDGATDTVQSPEHLYAGGGTYTVTLTTTTPYCSGTGTASITVEARPVATISTAPSTGCAPLDVAFTNTSTGAANFIWYFGDGGTSNDASPGHTYQNYGLSDSVYTAMLVAGTVSGCSDTTTVAITVAPGVMAQFTNDAVPGCAPPDVQFTNTSTGATSYLWDFGDSTSSTATSPSHTYVNTTGVLQMMTVTLTATSWAGCTITAQQSIAVYPAPNFTFSAQPDSGCTPLNVTFPSVLGAVGYQWNFGDGSTGSGPTPIHTYLNTTDSTVHYLVRLTATNAFGCMDSTAGEVTVFPTPAAAFNIGQNSGCHPLTTTLENLSQAGNTFHWTYGDGLSSDTMALEHAHTWYNYSGPGTSTYAIGLTVTTEHGCSSSSAGQVQVFPQVTAAFVADSMGCSPFNPHFVNVSSGADGYLWTFGDGGGSIETNPGHAYLNEGLSDSLFHPVLIASSPFGCSDTATAAVLVHPAPIAQFTASPATGCTPMPVNVQDFTIGASTSSWLFGDGTFLDSVPGDVAHVYENTTGGVVDHTIQLVATTAFGCTDTATAPIQVYPAVHAQFDMPTEACSPAILNLSDSSSGASQVLWDMGDGVTLVGQDVQHTYVNTGTTDLQFIVSLTASSIYGCTSTVQDTLIVHPLPQAAFTATPFGQMWPNDTVNIANTTVDGQWGYSWDFGDGSNSTAEDPAAHIYGTWGQYTITLTVANGSCTDTATQTITIEPPLPAASFIGSGEGCAPLTVAFTNTSVQALSFQWDFGDGNSSIADSPAYTYYSPGTYTVTLTAYGIDGGTTTAVKVDSVIVHPDASAFFTLQPNEVTAPAQPVFTYNLSANANNFIWDFGDGSTSNETNPVHYYQEAGTYDVFLIANNTWNCPDTFLLQDAVTALASGEITFPNAFTPGSNGPTDGTYDDASMDNDIFHPMSKGVQEYHLQVFNRWGELLFETNNIDQGWDGYYRGQPSKQDVYVWKAYVKFGSGDEKRLTGDVTLLR